jgi:hypothetical protein
VIGQNEPAIELLELGDGVFIRNVPISIGIIETEFIGRGPGKQADEATCPAFDDREDTVGGAIETVCPFKEDAVLEAIACRAGIISGGVHRDRNGFGCGLLSR